MKSPGRSMEDLGLFIRSGFVLVVCTLLLLVMLSRVPLSSVADPPFTTNIRVSPNGAGDGIWGGYRLLSTAVAPNGTVYVVWEDARIYPPLDTEIYFSRSIDGGETFSDEKVISDSPTQKQDLNPVIEVDSEGNIYVLYATLAWAGGGVRFVKSTDGGETFSSSVRIDDPPGYGGRPDIYIDSNDFINVAYEGGGDPNIHFTRSTDGGITWGDGLDNNNDVQVSDDTNSSMQSSPRLAVDFDGNINVAWVDGRGVGSRWDTYFSRSTDGGVTFSANIRLNDDPPTENQQSNVDISTGENGEIFVVSRTCCSTRNGIYFYRSTDGGLTFNDGLENDNDPEINDRSAMNYRIASIDTDASGRLNIVYEADNHIYYTNSSDNGNNIGDGVPNTDPRVQDVLGSDRFHPELDVDSCGHVYAFWMDTRNGHNDVYGSKLINLSTDLSVFDHELAFDLSGNIMLGSPISISAIVHNYCTQFVTQAKVRFFLGNPSIGQQIGSDRVINNLQPQAGFGYANLTWTPTSPGEHLLCAFVDPDDDIKEFNERNNIACGVISVNLPPIDPPRNLTTKVTGLDIELDWEPSISQYVDHYLIYRAEHQRGFDFGSPAYDTFISMDPLATNWTDGLAASPSSPRQYYYVVRAANSTVDLKSTTSNTAGKWVRFFNGGLNVFSLPLEPSQPVYLSGFLDNLTHSVHGKWMNQEGKWVKLLTGSGVGANDVEMEIGEAYEVFLSAPSEYTFCGRPASMIVFREGPEDVDSFMESLRISVLNDDISLSWDSVPGVGEYWIFKAKSRMGLHDSSLEPVVKLPSAETSWLDPNALLPGEELFYTVMPVNISGAFYTSTYSVGVMSLIYLSGSDTFALPLDVREYRTLDEYCDEIPGTVGMAYLIRQVWKFHLREMPKFVYDTTVVPGEGYQINTIQMTNAVFVGI